MSVIIVDLNCLKEILEYFGSFVEINLILLVFVFVFLFKMFYLLERFDYVIWLICNWDELEMYLGMIIKNDEDWCLVV